MTDPTKGPARDRYTIEDLVAVMAALRTPVTGCPWDLEQDFATIAPYTIEEAYEVADAIERRDLVDLEEELGDLLLQVVYHARMAEEENAFAFGDVVTAITRKMIRRHPHVFGDADARSAGAAKGMWEGIKAEEKAEKAARKAASGRALAAKSASVLADVPVALPALTRAVKLQDKAAAVGFDWPGLAPVFAKLREELGELEQEIARARPAGAPAESRPEVSDAIREEFGDLLFVVANVARHLQIDPEAALSAANAKFARRFGHVEARLAGMGKRPEDSDLAEMDRLWDEVRAADKTRPR